MNSLGAFTKISQFIIVFCVWTTTAIKSEQFTKFLSDVAKVKAASPTHAFIENLVTTQNEI